MFVAVVPAVVKLTQPDPEIGVKLRKFTWSTAKGLKNFLVTKEYRENPTIRDITNNNFIRSIRKKKKFIVLPILWRVLRY